MFSTENWTLETFRNYCLHVILTPYNGHRQDLPPPSYTPGKLWLPVPVGGGVSGPGQQGMSSPSQGLWPSSCLEQTQRGLETPRCLLSEIKKWF